MSPGRERVSWTGPLACLAGSGGCSRLRPGQIPALTSKLVLSGASDSFGAERDPSGAKLLAPLKHAQRITDTHYPGTNDHGDRLHV
jgi:hypothetical protein